MASKTTIALFLPVGLEYSSQIARGVANYLTHHPRFHAIEFPYRYGGRSPLPKGDWEFDGAILWAHTRDSWVPELVDRGIKTINCGGDWQDNGVVAVAFDAEAAAQAAADYLVELGRSSYAHIAHMTSEQPPAVRLLDLFREHLGTRATSFAALELTGVDPSTNGQRRLGRGRETELVNFLKTLPKPVSIWCPADNVAVLTSRVAVRAGFRVPEDIAVLGMGDYLLGRFNDPPISSIPQPGEIVGMAAAKLLHNLLDGAPEPNGPVRLAPPKVVERMSTVHIADPQDDVRRAYELIQANATQGLTVNDLMQVMSISQKTLNDRFRHVYGRTPGEQIRLVRLERAQQLLTQTDLNITTVAHICGFQNLNRFNIFFKREAGMAPSVYRRKTEQ